MTQAQSVFSPRYFNLYYIEVNGKTHSDEQAALQILSPVHPSLINSQARRIDVSVWFFDGYDLHDSHIIRADGIVSGNYLGIWSGTGTAVQFETQYFPYTRQPFAEISFAISVCPHKREAILHRLRFDDSAQQVTLRSHFLDTQKLPQITQFKLEQLEVPTIA